MLRLIKNILRRTFVYGIFNRIRSQKNFRDWMKNGRPVPPPHLFKQQIVTEYAQLRSINILIETGTYLGAMVDATKHEFSKIFSIELDNVLYERAQKKFSKYNHITIIHGDSSEVLHTS